MNAYTTEPHGQSYLSSPPVLIAGDSDVALQRAALTVEAAGARIGAVVPLDNAADRIALQASASAVWIELDRDGGPAMDRLLQQVRGDVFDGRYSAVVSASNELVDLLFCSIGGSPVELVIDGSEAERTAALAIATSGIHRTDLLSDVASDRSSERLRQLSDEVSRIASTLARLSTGPEVTQRPVPVAANMDAPHISGEMVRQVIRARRQRSRFFNEELFADPAWDMLLDLLQAEIAQLRVPVSSLCIAAAVPATTALRWIKAMTDKGLFLRRADPHDGRRVFVELSPEASGAMRRYFAEVGSVATV
ncbi:MAG: winged helix-turn-helix transcriptional regulator [Sphingomonas sp.]|nr:winged helix-turn-helix transcriptional regulator [Sphingomonas sp.]